MSIRLGYIKIDLIPDLDEYLIKERELFMARTTKGTQQKRRSKGDGSLFPNKRGGWTARYRKKGLPDKEFNAPTKGEAKALLDRLEDKSRNTKTQLLQTSKYRTMRTNTYSAKVSWLKLANSNKPAWID